MIRTIKKYLWDWPDGMVWKLTDKYSIKARKEKYALFMKHICLKENDAILDVGVSPQAIRGGNYLERWYPYPERITALSNDDKERYRNFNNMFPKVQLVFGMVEN